MSLRHPAWDARLRRRELLLAGALCAGGTRAAMTGEAGKPTASWPTGWVQPRDPAPATVLVDADARAIPLAERVRGHVTVVQLIFTGCGTTCPTQGALFSRMAERHKSKPVSWLSISIDALSDDPARLRAWQDRLGIRPAWQAAVPAVNEVDRLVQFLRGGPAATASHTTQVFGFDRQGRLAYRSGDAPPTALLDQLVLSLL